MVQANKDADKDYESILNLIKNLKNVKANRFVLISTIGIFEDFGAVNDEHSTKFEKILAYGKNRRFLEKFVINQFHKIHIIRLPALFGRNIKKNFLFDLLNPAPTFLRSNKFNSLMGLISTKEQSLLKFYYKRVNNNFHLNRSIFLNSNDKLQLINILNEYEASSIYFHSTKSTYQFYNLSYLWNDIKRVIDYDLDVSHFATEPISAREIYLEVLKKEMPLTNAKIHKENMITKYSNIWESGNYIRKAGDIMNDIKRFYQNNL